MRGQGAAAFRGGNKKNGSQKKSSGEFHALMAQADSVIKKLTKTIKKQNPKSNKKGSEMSLTLKMSLLKMSILMAFTSTLKRIQLKMKTRMPTSVILIGAAIMAPTNRM